jgi:hypothetical protein
MKQKTFLRFIYVKECLILGLAVSSLIFLVLDQLGKLSPSQLHTLYIYDVVVGSIFIVEFLLEIWLTTDKKDYMQHNWFYLFAAIPLPFAWAQLLRSIRIIRVVKLLKFGTHFQYEKNIQNNNLKEHSRKKKKRSYIL